jgi:hypothetical protein
MSGRGPNTHINALASYSWLYGCCLAQQVTREGLARAVDLTNAACPCPTDGHTPRPRSHLGRTEQKEPHATRICGASLHLQIPPGATKLNRRSCAKYCAVACDAQRRQTAKAYPPQQ